VKTHPDTAFEGSAPMYGLIAKAPLRKLVKKQVFGIVEQMYSATGGGSVAELSAESAEAGDAPKEGAIPSLPPLLIRAMRVKARLRRLFGRA
jgi:hypothetical protein